MESFPSPPLPQSPPPPPPSPPPPPLSHAVEMEIHPPVSDDPTTSSSLWNWDDLLDFTVDDHFPISLDSFDQSTIAEVSQIEASTPDRVRKRDPRLACSNFLAGRVPCACPEIDEKLEEEEASMPGKKRVRVTRICGGVARCQVPECEADISELKGYHRRHRVCLRCANASTVILHGETKRYCQQCGKFHLLSDFDEGKRSCRRKLERHNNRRRRRPVDSKGVVDKDAQGDLQVDDNLYGGEVGKDNLEFSSQVVEKESLIESEDRLVSTLHSGPKSQICNSDTIVSTVASVETQMDARKDDAKFSHSPSYCDNKSAYSSVCPTGRISFKLYDWNPAEFPRRLRHQIFQWLASMPVELEGYIRPGCTILTAFISMPTFMWKKLSEDPVLYIHDFVVVPGKMLSKKGPMLVFLNDMIFHVMKDGNSVTKVDVESCAPRLHYVHPTCFEAGKPIEIVACGNNMLQRKFRLLVSFAGKYLAHDYCLALPHGHTEAGSGLNHQLCKIFIQHTDPNAFGPAFIEVENENGLSNFIPVLIADKETCSEMKIIQQRFEMSHLPSSSHCEISTSRQMALAEFVVDIGWLLKMPPLEDFQQIMTFSQVQRFNSLLKFLLHHESTVILDKILQNLKFVMNKIEASGVVNGPADADVRLLRKYMDHASDFLHKKIEKNKNLGLKLESKQERDCVSGTSDRPSVASFTNEDVEKGSNNKLAAVLTSSSSIVGSERVPFLSREVVMNVNLIKESPSSSRGRVFCSRLKSRSTIFAIAIFAICFAVCAVILHPQEVHKFAVSIRRCLTDI